MATNAFKAADNAMQGYISAIYAPINDAFNEAHKPHEWERVMGSAEFKEDTAKEFVTKLERSMSIASPRTVYMDSNIALTDGKRKVAEEGANVIPNLYEAVIGLRRGDEAHDRRITEVEGKVGELSQLKAGIASDNLVSAINSVKQAADGYISTADKHIFAIREDDRVTICPGSSTDGNISNTVHDARSEHAQPISTLRLSAKDVEFEVAAPVTNAYIINGFIDNKFIYDPADVKAIHNPSAYLWAPIESNNEDIGIIGEHGHIYVKEEDGYHLYVPHAVIQENITIEKEVIDVNHGKTLVYNVASIIEAIQEINRRTMFIDTNNAFQCGIHTVKSEEAADPVPETA